MTWSNDLAEAEIDKLYARIEALERENAAEKALGDRLAEWLEHMGDGQWNEGCERAVSAYRKARGL